MYAIGSATGAVPFLNISRSAITLANRCRFVYILERMLFLSLLKYNSLRVVVDGTLPLPHLAAF